MRYMTVKNVLDYVDEVKPNIFSRSTKLIWLNEIEYRVQTDVMLLAAESVQTVPDSDNHELLVPAPWYSIYYNYLFMKISEHLEESSEQNNRADTFNKDFTRFMRWWADTYLPGNGDATFKGYYLVGPQGPQGPQGNTGFSPVVETEQTATGEHIKITDKNAVHEFDIRNGSAMAARVEDETAVFTTAAAQYQPVEISDEGDHFETDTVEGALDELYETATNIASDVQDLQDDLETEQTAIRTVALGGTGASSAESAMTNLGVADYIVERGTSGIWTYEKYKDGTFKCWGNKTWDTYWSVPVSLPFSALNANSYFVNVTNNGGLTYNGVYQVANDSASQFKIYHFDQSGSALASAASVNLLVIGRWK